MLSKDLSCPLPPACLLRFLIKAQCRRLVRGIEGHSFYSMMCQQDALLLRRLLTPIITRLHAQLSSLLVLALVLLSSAASAEGYSRRFRSPLNQRRLLVQSLAPLDRWGQMHFFVCDVDTVKLYT